MIELFYNYLHVGQFELARSLLETYKEFHEFAAQVVRDGKVIGFSPAMPSVSAGRWMLITALNDFGYEFKDESPSILDSLARDIRCSCVLLEMNGLFAHELLRTPPSENKYAQQLLQFSSDTELCILYMLSKDVAGIWCLESLVQCFPENNLVMNLLKDAVNDPQMPCVAVFNLVSKYHALISADNELLMDLFPSNFCKRLENVGDKKSLVQTILRDWHSCPTMAITMCRICWTSEFPPDQHFLSYLASESSAIFQTANTCDLVTQLRRRIGEFGNAIAFREFLILVNLKYVSLSLSKLESTLVHFWIGADIEDQEEAIKIPVCLGDSFQRHLHSRCCLLFFRLKCACCIGRSEEDTLSVFNQLQNDVSLFDIVVNQSEISSHLFLDTIQKWCEMCSQHGCMHYHENDIHMIKCFCILVDATRVHSAADASDYIDKTFPELLSMPAAVRAKFIPMFVSYFLAFLLGDIPDYINLFKRLVEFLAIGENENQVIRLNYELRARFFLVSLLIRFIPNSLEAFTILKSPTDLVHLCLTHDLYDAAMLTAQLFHLPDDLKSVIEFSKFAHEKRKEIDSEDLAAVSMLLETEFQHGKYSHINFLLSLDNAIIYQDPVKFAVLMEYFRAHPFEGSKQVNNVLDGYKGRTLRDVFTSTGSLQISSRVIFQEPRSGLVESNKGFLLELESAIEELSSCLIPYLSFLHEHIQDLKELYVLRASSPNSNRHSICNQHPLQLLSCVLDFPDQVKRIAERWHLDLKVIVSRACYRTLQLGGTPHLLETAKRFEQDFTYGETWVQGVKPLSFLIECAASTDLSNAAEYFILHGDQHDLGACDRYLNLAHHSSATIDDPAEASQFTNEDMKVYPDIPVGEGDPIESDAEEETVETKGAYKMDLVQERTPFFLNTLNVLKVQHDDLSNVSYLHVVHPDFLN